METVINIETDDVYSLDQRQEVEPRSVKSRNLKRYTYINAITACYHKPSSSALIPEKQQGFKQGAKPFALLIHILIKRGKR